MPQAAFADSTTARSFQHILQVDFDVFGYTIDEIEALAHMLEATLREPGKLHADIVSGIASLFRGRISDLRDIFDKALEERQRWKGWAGPQEARGTPVRPEILALVFEVVSDKMRDVGFYMPPENVLEWDSATKDRAWRLAIQIFNELCNRLPDSGDFIDAAKQIRWIEDRVMEELGEGPAEPEKSKQRPTSLSMREQFIAQAHADGYFSADISMALGLRQTAVKRAIRKMLGVKPEEQAKTA